MIPSYQQVKNSNLCKFIPHPCEHSRAEWKSCALLGCDSMTHARLHHQGRRERARWTTRTEQNEAHWRCSAATPSIRSGRATASAESDLRWAANFESLRGE